MKRVLTAALFGGLFVLAAPQAAFAEHYGKQSAEHPAECGAPRQKTAESGKPTPPRSSERSAPGASFGDRQQDFDSSSS